MLFIDVNGHDYRPNRYLTFRDILLVPQRSGVSSRNDPKLDMSTRIGNFHLNAPILSANMDTVTESDMVIAMHAHGGFGILHRFYPSEDEYFADIRKVIQECGKVAFSIGLKYNYDLIRRVQELVDSDDKIAVCLDVAHGHMDRVLDVCRLFKSEFPNITLIAGNVATPQAARDLVDYGADAVKVGVGSGSICTTRIVTGHGVPMLTAIMQIREEIGEDASIIADGGIREAGDIVKAIAAGASAVMCGSLFSGYGESPGETIEINGCKFKQYRGQSSRSFLNDLNKDGVAAEGVLADVPYKGCVYSILNELTGGIRSGLSYSGVFNLDDLYNHAQAIEISHHGWDESTPHISRLAASVQ